jgi:hypothetical protein
VKRSEALKMLNEVSELVNHRAKTSKEKKSREKKTTVVYHRWRCCFFSRTIDTAPES